MGERPGRNPAPEVDETYLDALDDFIRFVLSVEGLSPETARAYQSHLEAYGFWAARRGVDALHPGVRGLRSYLGELKRAGYALRTVAAHLSAIRSLFHWCAVEGISVDESATAIQTPKIGRSLPKTLSPGQVEALFSAPDPDTPEGLRDRCMLELFYATGARISELARLRVADLDLSARTVRLFGKGSKERIVPIHRRAAQAVRIYLATGRPVLLAGRTDDASSSAETRLFISGRGNPMDSSALRYRFGRLARAAGLPGDITPHAMRHTFATDLLSGGADLRSVQELLGHASLSTTQIYTHLTPERLRSAVRRAHPRG